MQLAPASGHVRLFADLSQSWPAVEPPDREWEMSQLESMLTELECSKGTRQYNSHGGTAPFDSWINVEATANTQTSPLVWCMGGFAPTDMELLESAGLYHGGVRIVIAQQASEGNGTALAVSTGLTKL